MNQSECNNSDHDNVHLPRQQQQQPQLPDHLKCGEVFTWKCGEELYAVECKLCEDRPLCPLSEFPQHMEVWHTDWEESLKSPDDNDDQFDDHNEDLYLSFSTEDSGLYEEDEQNVLQDDLDVEILEPFEQVLIEQDNAVDTTQINDANIEEKINDDNPEEEQTIEDVIAKNFQQQIQPKRNNIEQQLNINNSIDVGNRKEKSSLDNRENRREYGFSLSYSERDSWQHEDQSENQRETRYHDSVPEEFNSEKVEDIELNKSNDVKTRNNSTNLINVEKRFKRKQNVETVNNCITQEFSQFEVAATQRNKQEKVREEHENRKESHEIFANESPAKKRRTSKKNKKKKNYSKTVDKLMNQRKNSKNSTGIKKNLTSNLQQKISTKRKLNKRRDRSLVSKEKLNKVDNKTKNCCYLEENFKDDLTMNPEKSNKVRKKNMRHNSMEPNDVLNDLMKNSYQTTENCVETRRKSFRRKKFKENCLTSLATKGKLKRFLKTSSDFANHMPNLTLEDLSSNKHSVKKYLSISESSTDLVNIAFDRDCETLNPLNSTDIYSLLTSSSLENPSVTSYDAESSLYLSPDSLSSALRNYDCISEENVNKGNPFFNCKQNLNNLFDSCSTINENQSLTPQSPKTEEEHFEFFEPKEKLTKHHIIQLISLYKEHPRLWDQSHVDFCEPHLCRHSWRDITDKWNDYCKRKFTITEVRIRICTLCQRYLKERERLELEGELDESAKFSYYEEMQFLEQQKSLQKRRDLYDQQNEKVLEMFKHFPVLWHVGCYKLRQAKERTKAFQSISTALRLCGIHLSSLGVQKRIRSLKKCYRLEKIRYLHCQVEQTKFESTFKHFQRMQFLQKHIDPFVCRICGKIFENLSQYREHLDTENHGSILDEESENEADNADIVTAYVNETCSTIPIQNLTDNIENINAKENLAITNNMEILEVPATNASVIDSLPYLNEVPLYDASPVINEVLIYAANSCEEQILNSLQIGGQIIEEIMENVSMNDTFTTQSLDNFINSVNDCEDITLSNCIASATLPVTLTDIEIPHIKIQNDISIDPTMAMKISNETNFNENHEMEQTQTGNNYPPDITVNVQCEGYSLDLKLNTNDCFEIPTFGNEEPNTPEVDSVFARLPDSDIRKMIAVYRKHPQLWDPNHLDYNSRNLRRQAWSDLTAEYCKLVGRQFSWRTLHRKLADYAKYYKKLITDQQDYEKVENKWTFFEDLNFLDDVIAVHDELQRSVHHRDNNFKIIGIYKSLPQLWDIKHADFNKRPIKQRNIEQMCYRLQEEYNLQITPERLKNRLIELRAQYRAAKKQRLQTVKNQQIFTPEFEFYEALNFLDPHIDPFICDQCKMEYKKLTDFNQHQRKEHENISKQQPLSLTDHREGRDHLLENICHICGIKFSSRSNLIHHVRRHEGVKNYECTFCTKKFFSSHSLKIHTRSHTKECPYTCEKCGSSFVSASKLNQHVKRHSNKKDFACDHCPKNFYTAFERERHVRRHLNIRDKICPICGKSFVVGSSYYAHMMLHNDTKRFSCDICDMKFAQYAGLYKHKKRHHKT